MYLINTSFHAERSVADAIMEELRSGLMSKMEASTLFTGLLMAEILVEVDPECKSFTLQGMSGDLDKAVEWLHTEGASCLSELHKRYGQKVVFFTTPMKIIQ
ncbi:MAG: DUF4286 family protein [Muribaculaceae bacterium]|nr:DUF4286 family protein [Muribaculaceae bacterium]